MCAVFDRAIRLAEANRLRLRVPREVKPTQRLANMHYHYRPEVFLQLQGVTEFRFPRENFELVPDEVLVIPAGVPHGETVRDEGGKPFRNLVAGFYNNTISLREDAEVVTKKIRQMPTDPARVRRTDAGDPDKCPVWQLHQVYSNAEVKDWVVAGCKSAGIGCLDCKQPVIDGVLAEQKPMFERAQPYLDDPALVRRIVADGCERARAVAGETMRDVKEAMGLGY